MIQRYFDKMKPPDMKKKITVIEETADRMRGIVMNLLDINALESGSKNIRKQFFDITNVIRGSVEELEPAAKEKNIIIRSKGIEKEVLVYSDSDSVRMILDNLISNAIKFSPKDTEVTVTLSAEKGKAYISVKDDGPGLSDEDKNKLFGKFARLSAQPTGGENSTGLGLSIVKKLTDMIGGDILCESRQGSGAVFILKLPLDT
jgi:signal transduction histidine kinase